MASRSVPKIVLLVETARGYGRQLLRGIVRYARHHGPWSFYVTPGDIEQAIPKLQRWGGTGVIARVTTPAMAKAILKSGLPTIVLDLSDAQLRPTNRLSKLSEIASDSRHAAYMAADHLLERQFRHYAFVGIADRVWSDRRQAGFCDRVIAAGFTPLVYAAASRKGDGAWGREQVRLAAWLKKLPKPLGLMACNDDRGREVLEACRAADIRVPEQVAVVGVDNDDLLCDLADPPLSSVALNAEQGGYRAAALLDKMMRGGKRIPARLVVEPLGVVTRQSTEIIALDDTEVVRAIQFIQKHAVAPIRVDDVVECVQISRRALELRFRQTLGRTIHAEILRVRLERSRRLLQETDLPISKVATSVGFDTASYFVQIFRKINGTTPARYRTQTRIR